MNEAIKKVIEVRGYYRKCFINGVKGKKWVEPHIRKIRYKIPKGQKSVDDYERKKAM